jgi:hypothetical protein
MVRHTTVIFAAVVALELGAMTTSASARYIGHGPTAISAPNGSRHGAGGGVRSSFRLPTKSTLYRAWRLGKYASHVSRLSLLVENLIRPKT